MANTAQGEYGGCIAPERHESPRRGQPMANRVPTFPHRHNPDGSYDSICTGCFVTVAKAKPEAELEVFEKDHVCKGLNIGTLFYPEDRK